MHQEIFKKILTAKVYDVVKRTDLDFAPNISNEISNEVFLKREDTQPVFSFKLRGAYNRMAHLAPSERKKGVLCCSAGNHAQGVAFSANRLGIPAVIVMPETAPEIKVNAVKNLGAKVILKGDSYSDAAAYCQNLRKEMDAHFIHPFDDPYVIAGQGTIGKEILEDCPQVDMVFVPVGGGGLLAGICSYLKQLRPEIKIIGVHPQDSTAMQDSVFDGKRVELGQVGIFADGVAVKKVGDLNFQLLKDLVDDFVTVSTDEMCSAIGKIYDETRVVLEPAGALALAGLVKYSEKKKLHGKRLVAVNSGANMNFQRLSFVAERVLTGQKREALYAVELSEKPGALQRLCSEVIGDRGITEFNYRHQGGDKAQIFVGILCKSRQDAGQFASKLDREGYRFLDLTHNELAKEHLRHMVGGVSSQVEREQVYRFRFPERPGALSQFLTELASRWNITMFNYRSHGGDFGRVLMGFQVPEQEMSEFQSFIRDSKFGPVNETHNQAYKTFLNPLFEKNSMSI